MQKPLKFYLTTKMYTCKLCLIFVIGKNYFRVKKQYNLYKIDSKLTSILTI